MKNKDIKGVYGYTALHETNQRLKVHFKNYIKDLLGEDTTKHYRFYPVIGCLKMYKLSFAKNGLLANMHKQFDRDTKLSLSAYITEEEKEKLLGAGTVTIKDDMFDMEISTVVSDDTVTFHVNVYSHIENIEKVIGEKQEPHHELTDVNGTPIKIGDRVLYYKHSLNISVLKGYDEKHMLMENGDSLIIYSDKCKDVLVVNNKRININIK